MGATKSAASDNYFYVANKDEIVRMSLVDFTKDTFKLNEYYRDIISISPTDTSVIITASNKGGKTVVDELDCFTGIPKNLTTSSSGTITLQRIR